MTRKTIVTGGNEAFQVSPALIYSPPMAPIDGPACRVLAWILWEAHARSRWPQAHQAPVDTSVRYHGQDLLAGAGLDRRNGYGVLREALGQIVALCHDGIPTPLVWDWTELPGSNYELRLSETLMMHHMRPMARYALLDMTHIRQLKSPLDMAIYARACHVARAGWPRFELSIQEIARHCRTGQEVSWRSLRRQVLQAITRVCAATGGRVIVQGWCSGDNVGVDRLRCHVGIANDTAVPRFPPQHQAIYLEVRPDGSFRLPGPPGRSHA